MTTNETESPTFQAAAFHGLATNQALSIEERLSSALQALALYEAETERHETEQAAIRVVLTRHYLAEIVCSHERKLEAMARLNVWCAENDPRQQQFAELDENAAGGNKVFTPSVWAMSGNYFPHEKLAPILGSFGWRDPDGVVLIVRSEHGDLVRIYRPDGAS